MKIQHILNQLNKQKEGEFNIAIPYGYKKAIELISKNNIMGYTADLIETFYGDRGTIIKYFYIINRK